LIWKDEAGEYKYEGHFDANGKFTGKGNYFVIKENYLTQMVSLKVSFFKVEKRALAFIGTYKFSKI
jgi:hypothetical protein